MSDHPQTPAPTISVVIRSYNEERFIDQLFVGLSEQDRQDFEVILVDSGSTDHTVTIAESHGARVVQIPKSEFSFGRSLNMGCAAARGEILVFASAHVYPTRRDWLTELARPFEDPRVSLVYGKQRGAEITKFSERQIFEKWFPNTSSANQSSYFCNNANCAVRRSLWAAAPYDETLTGLEDLAWAKHIQRGGGRIAYSAEAEIVHIHDETWGRVRNRYQREAIALRSIEPSMRFGFPEFLRLASANIVQDLKQARRLGTLWSEMGGIFKFRICQFWGTYTGFSTASTITMEIQNRFYFPSNAEDHAIPPHGLDPVAPSAASSVRIKYDGPGHATPTLKLQSESEK